MDPIDPPTTAYVVPKQAGCTVEDSTTDFYGPTLSNNGGAVSENKVLSDIQKQTLSKPCQMIFE
jgi:hypothetical protein